MSQPALQSEAPPRSVQPYRERLLAGMADLCAAAPRAREAKVQAELAAVFNRVLDGADLPTRSRFAERLAAEDWPGLALVGRLAGDHISVASPVIARSPVLDEAALAELAATGDAEIRAAVAGRPKIGPAVADAVIDTGEPLALAALASNTSADLSAPVLRRLVEASRRWGELREPLARRPDLYPELGRRLLEWTGGDVAESLSARFGFGRAPAAAPQPADAEARLVAKLEAAGQLKPGFLLRTLREGKLSLFKRSLGVLGGFAPAELDRALSSDRPDLLALACAAVGVDRSVFPTVLELVRGLNGGAPRGGGGEALEAALLLSDPVAAAQAFRAGLAGL